MLRVLTFALALVVLSVSADADDRSVYRWTDEQGNVHYSDRPQSDDATPTGLTSKATDPTRVASARGKLLTPPADGQPDPEASAGTEPAKTEEDPGERADRFAENCRRAQAALQSIVNARRLYVPTGDGDRRYLDQNETTARRTQAEADVQQWCR